MKKEKKPNQRMLQISFGIGLIVLVVLIEFVAIHPSGIYSYTQKGYKEFKIGFSKDKVLEKINHQKTIRTIKTCGPDKMFKLTSKRWFELEYSMTSSDYWICNDRTGKDFLFLFSNGVLEMILVQRTGLGKKQGSVLFKQCRPDLMENIHTYLADQTQLEVFYDTDSQKKKDKQNY